VPPLSSTRGEFPDPSSTLNQNLETDAVGSTIVLKLYQRAEFPRVDVPTPFCCVAMDEWVVLLRSVQNNVIAGLGLGPSKI
jgi:hypothetical protein